MSLTAYGLDGSILVLTAAQLDIASKVINVLLPVEEITKWISEDTACISVIIPLVRGLRKTTEQSGEDRGVRTMKSQMLESLQKKFGDIEDTDFLARISFFSSTSYRENAKFSMLFMNFRTERACC